MQLSTFNYILTTFLNVDEVVVDEGFTPDNLQQSSARERLFNLPASGGMCCNSKVDRRTNQKHFYLWGKTEKDDTNAKPKKSIMSEHLFYSFSENYVLLAKLCCND